MNDENRAAWTIAQSEDVFQIRGWGEPYFRINTAGHVEVWPDTAHDAGIDLYDLTRDLQARGLALPLLIRFPTILHHRLTKLYECFRKSIEEYGYPGEYRGVYPVKVNQQRHLIDELVSFGSSYHHGLEAGSKPELLIALASMAGSDGLIICNGYKDLQYMETALIAQQFAKTVILVLERVEELDMVFRAADKLGVTPVLGVRAKLGSKGMGQWADSAGEQAKFGLSSAGVVQVVDRLAERGMLESLQLLHFHIGSQVSSIIPIKNALREAAQFYVELAKMGAGMRYIDVGGGLAIDYDGSKTDYHASKNYTMQEYAHGVVGAVHEACERASLPCPTIVSESGRAVSAHHSVLLFDVLGTNETHFPVPEPAKPEEHAVIHGLYETWKGVAPKNIQEAWHDATQAKEEAHSLFRFGYLGLRERARAERLYLSCGWKILEAAQRARFVPEEVQEVQKQLSAIYYCNFSIFQSAPDTWAIDQLFPIIPIHRLDERPTIRARLADLTCDSDGIIDHFIDAEEVKPVLDVHELRDNEPYVMGMFLAGAYQEILGDMHNLFGDTNTVHVQVTPEGYQIAHVIKGDSMDQVLRYMAHDPDAMRENVRRQAEAALSAGRITLNQMKLLMEHYEASLRSYTYLTDDE